MLCSWGMPIWVWAFMVRSLAAEYAPGHHGLEQASSASVHLVARVENSGRLRSKKADSTTIKQSTHHGWLRQPRRLQAAPSSAAARSWLIESCSAPQLGVYLYVAEPCMDGVVLRGTDPYVMQRNYLDFHLHGSDLLRASQLPAS